MDSSSDTAVKDIELRPYENLIAAILYLIFGVVGIAGNGCILYLFAAFNDLRKIEGLFLSACKTDKKRFFLLRFRYFLSALRGHAGIS